MIQIDLNAFAKAIRETYPGYTEAFALGYARNWAERLDPMLQEAVQCWIDGKPLPEVAYQPEGGKRYSIESIMALRGVNDSLQAMLLLSDYIRDPAVGEGRILRPIRGRR